MCIYLFAKTIETNLLSEEKGERGRGRESDVGTMGKYMEKKL